MKKKRLILIGASTGGPGHIEKILSSLGHDFSAALIISQHMDPLFLPSMIQHYNDMWPSRVSQAEVNASISPSDIVFTFNGLTDLVFDPEKGLHLKKSDPKSPYTPSIDSVFSSAARLCDRYDIAAFLLTGIGDDGARGLLELKNAGALCVSESQESCVVYGMPKAAVEIGASTRVLPLEQIINEINKFGREDHVL